jgi:hypothetical protein
MSKPVIFPIFEFLHESGTFPVRWYSSSSAIRFLRLNLPFLQRFLSSWFVLDFNCFFN